MANTPIDGLRKALRWLCIAFLVFVGVAVVVGAVSQHGWAPIVFASLVVAAVYGAFAL